MLIAYKLNLQLFMATVGTTTIFQGLAFVMTQSKTISDLPPAFKVIGQGYLGAIPIPVIIMVIVFAIGWFYLVKRHILAAISMLWVAMKRQHNFQVLM